MEFDRKTLLAFLLIGLILVIVNTELYQRLLFKNRPPVAVETQRQAPEAEEAVVEEAPPAAATAKKAAALAERQSGAEDSYVIETPLYVAELSNKGAVLRRMRLKKYLDAQDNPVTIFDDAAGSPSVLLPVGNDTLDTALLMFSTTGRSAHLTGKDSTRLVFTVDLRGGQTITKTYRFTADRYDIELQVEFSDIRTLTSAYSYALQWQSPLLSTEANVKDDMGHARGHYALVGKTESFDAGDKPIRHDGWVTSWVAARTKYFASAIIPVGTEGNGLSLQGRKYKDAAGNELKAYTISLFMPLYREGNRGHRFKLFVGPLDYRILRSYKANLHRMMDLGWKWVVEPFSVVILLAFTAVHEYVPNYGVVIIIFSILVKIILNPLTRRSTRSMKAMQNLQPKIAELREKYGKDAQRLNQETMKLYKEHGVNPLGGCFPTLLQMPLLFALFVVFRSAIELRHEPFVLWIKDLSAPDTIAILPFSMPLNVLPLVMGVTMFLQQKTALTDPKQKMMVYAMPVIFVILFNNFPSGLTLYYSLFNILSLIQQKYFPDKSPARLEKKRKIRPWKKMSLNAALARGRSRR